MIAVTVDKKTPAKIITCGSNWTNVFKAEIILNENKSLIIYNFSIAGEGTRLPTFNGFKT